MDNGKLKAIYGILQTERKNIEGVWSTINYYVTPFRGSFSNQISTESAVDWHENRRIFDSTAVNAANILASSLHGALTSPATRWFEVVFKDDELNSDGEAMVWLDQCSNQVYQALQDSNFNLEANETYLDLVSYGSSVLVEEEEEDAGGEYSGLIFQSVPIEECLFSQGWKGNIVMFFRRYSWTIRQIVDKFVKVPGDMDTMIPDHIKQANDRPDAEVIRKDVVLCIYERPDKKGNNNAGKKLAPKERPFGFKYMLLDTAEDLGEEGGYYEMPAFVPRWRKTNRSAWGNSPAMMALPDILTLNRLVELILKSTEKVVDPATLVTERGLLSDLDLEPGGKTVVRTLDDIGAYESKARFDVSQLQREQLVTAIRQAFYVDQLELKQSPAMTATEVNVRYELMQRLLGPTLGRLESDYLDPLVQRTFNILYRAGRLPPVPKVVSDAGAELDVTYVGPLARAQKSDVAQSVDRWVSRLAAIGQMHPNVLDIPDFDAVARELGALEGVPPKLMRSAAVVKNERKKREEAEAEAAQSANAAVKGKGMEAMGKGIQALNEAGVSDDGTEEAA